MSISSRRFSLVCLYNHVDMADKGQKANAAAKTASSQIKTSSASLAGNCTLKLLANPTAKINSHILCMRASAFAAIFFKLAKTLRLVSIYINRWELFGTPSFGFTFSHFLVLKSLDGSVHDPIQAFPTPFFFLQIDKFASHANGCF